MLDGCDAGRCHCVNADGQWVASGGHVVNASNGPHHLRAGGRVNADGGVVVATLLMQVVFVVVVVVVVIVIVVVIVVSGGGCVSSQMVAGGFDTGRCCRCGGWMWMWWLGLST